MTSASAESFSVINFCIKQEVLQDGVMYDPICKVMKVFIYSPSCCSKPVWLSSVEHKGDVMHKVRDLGFCAFSESEWWPNHPFQCFVEM